MCKRCVPLERAQVAPQVEQVFNEQLREVSINTGQEIKLNLSTLLRDRLFVAGSDCEGK